MQFIAQYTTHLALAFLPEGHYPSPSFPGSQMLESQSVFFLGSLPVLAFLAKKL